MNMHFAYIIQSGQHGRYYIGSTSDLEERLTRHNRGRNKSTKSGIPWKLVYAEEFLTQQDAYRHEMQIKSYKGGQAFKNLITKS